MSLPKHLNRSYDYQKITVYESRGLMKMNKIICLVLILTLALVSSVSALTVNKVVVNGVEISQDTTVSVLRGEDVDIWVQMTESPGIEVKDVRVKAWIEGYEYNDVQDETDLFDIHASPAPTPNVVSKNLKLKLPSDLEATESYTLNVGVFSQSAESIKYAWDFNLLVSPERHSLNVYDVIFNPSDKVVAGNNLYSKIRVENLGDKREENVKVTLTMPELGVTTSDYIDDLSLTDNYDSNDDEENAGDAELVVKIPENTKTGVYSAIVRISYGRGNLEEEKKYNIFVEAKKEETAVESVPGAPTENGGVVTSVISIDTTSQTVEQGESAVYKVMFANLGSKSETFSLTLSGVNFGTARVDPAFITVGPDKTGEAYVYVSTNEDSQMGTHGFTLSVGSDGNAIKDIALVTNVSEKIGGASGVSLTSILEWVFIVLFVVLIIVGVVLVVKKLKSGNEGTEEPTTETTSYY